MNQSGKISIALVASAASLLLAGTANAGLLDPGDTESGEPFVSIYPLSRGHLVPVDPVGAYRDGGDPFTSMRSIYSGQTSPVGATGTEKPEGNTSWAIPEQEFRD